jgi:hypothetical protein
MKVFMQDKISIGIIADWLVTYAGSEKVIKEFIELFPDSQLYSVVDYLSDYNRELFAGKRAVTTFIQNLPFSEKNIKSICL